jgi:HSP20 family protein
MATQSTGNRTGQQQSEQPTQSQQGGTNGQQQYSGNGGQQSGNQQGQDVQVTQGGQGESRAVQQRRQGGLSRYSRDPFAVMQQLSEEMDELFDSFFYGRPARRSRQSQLRDMWVPDVEVREEGNQVRVHVDVPGVPKDNVKVDIQEGMLTIQGERNEERNEGGEQQGFRRTERRYGSFYRSIPLPDGVDTQNAHATMKDGVLDITMPLSANRQRRRLDIKA